MTSDELERKLLDEYWLKEKSSQKAFIKSVRRTDFDDLALSHQRNAAEGKYAIILDTGRSVALGDYGSDCRAIPRSVLDQVVSAEPCILVLKLVRLV